MPPRPLVKEGTTGPDVLDAILRLNLAGADPQLLPTDDFDAAGTAAAKRFQRDHGLSDDGKIGQDTWPLLDQLDGGRLISATEAETITAARQQARALNAAGGFADARAIMQPIYANPRVPPELRAPIAANLAWAEHGMGNFDRARALYVEHILTLLLFDEHALHVRDTLQRLREVALEQLPGPLESDLNKVNLPPNG